MTRDERCKLGKMLMLEEELGMSEKVQALGSAVLSEVLRLEQAGEFEEAKAFEAFLPLDADFLSSLAPLLGGQEFEQTIMLYKKEKQKQRTAYLDGKR